MNNNSLLPFRIIQSTSESEGFLAQNLESFSTQSFGWQTYANCTYPQALIFSFEQPVYIQHMKIISHQTKISSHIYVSVSYENSLKIQNFNFQQIGKFMFTNNEQNNFQKRELKTVLIDSPANAIELVFEQPHFNSFNIYRQIGIIGVQFFGNKITQGQPMNTFQPSNSQLIRQQKDDQLDRLIENFQMQRQNLMERDDFNEANKVDINLQRLYDIKDKLHYLEQQKIESIQEQDFERAQVISQELLKLRQIVDNLGYTQTKIVDQIERRNINYQRSRSNSPQIDRQIESDMGEKRQQIPRRRNQIDQVQSMEQSQKIERQFSPNFDDRPLPSQKRQSQENQDEDEQRRTETEYDKRPLPALQKNNTQELKEYPTDNSEEDVKKEEIKLTKEQQNKVVEFYNTFDQNFLKECFCSNWKLRKNSSEKLLRVLETFSKLRLPNDIIVTKDIDQLIIGLWGLALNFVLDSVPLIYQNSCFILKKLLYINSNEFNTTNNLQNLEIKLYETILLKSSDFKELFDLSEFEEIVLTLIQDDILLATKLIQKLITPNMLKTKLKVKHLEGRANLLIKIIQNIPENLWEKKIEDILNFCVQNIENPNKQVRTSFHELIVTLYKISEPGIILNYLEKSGIRKPLFDLLKKDFQKIIREKNPQDKFKQYKQQVPIQNASEFTERGDISSLEPGHQFTEISLIDKNRNNQTSYQEDEDIESPERCNFCLRQDPNLVNEDQYDMHLWKECPMLIICEYCKQVVEISEMNIHLLEECSENNQFQECPKCHASIQNDFLKNHINEDLCKILRIDLDLQRCVLCQKDIQMDPQNPDQCWRQHLVVEGCPKNNRTKNH